ncbi:hypothetical protein KIM372_01050 [Bombiscardovia nodaiensis]|uniref:RCC1-like domain-containing protein n=1 Tax=Bombiscardovia nodaiensis TaxID=2932181 RepID=A0ABM8B5T7_9BIFI|nr:hypothetical protein KIM372_01050 [Bombiscardovia nodaiensis]
MRIGAKTISRRSVAILATLATLIGAFGSLASVETAHAAPTSNSDGFTIDPNGGPDTGGTLVTITPPKRGNSGGTAPVGKRMAGGNYHSLAIDDNNTVWTWGNNTLGQLGRGGTGGPQGETPAPITLPGAAVQVAAASDQSYALLSDGRLFAWGNNANGRLGLGAGGIVTAPRQVMIPGNPTIVSIGAGASNGVALDSTGHAWSWGSNDQNQLGIGLAGGEVYTPQPINGVTFKDLSVGGWHTLGHGTDGRVYAWGRNNDGQLGIGTRTNMPSPVATTYNYPILSAGGGFSVGLDAQGHAFTWGSNSLGQLGVMNSKNTMPYRAYPGPISSNQGNPSFTQISAGIEYVLALKADMPQGQVWGWGANNYGQILMSPNTGHGGIAGGGQTPSYTDNPQPGQGAISRPYQFVSANFTHSLGIDVYGNVTAWGGDSSDQLGNGGNSGAYPGPVAVLYIGRVTGSGSTPSPSPGGQQPVHIQNILFGNTMFTPGTAVSVDPSSQVWTLRAPQHAAGTVEVHVFYTDTDGSTKESVLEYTYTSTAQPTLQVDFVLGQDEHGVTAPGTAPSRIENITPGTSINAPPEPTWAGHTFDGWFNGPTKWDFNDPVTHTMTLTGHWSTSQTTISVTFKLGQDQYGEFAPGTTPPAIPVTPGTSIRAPQPEPTWPGHTFDGWFNGPTKWDFNDPVTHTMILTGHWTANAPTPSRILVTFDLNGAPGTKPADQQVPAGDRATEPNPAPSWGGYRFDGWFDGASKWDFTNPVNRTLNLVAHWTKTYEVKFDLHGAPGQPPATQIVVAGERAQEPPAPGDWNGQQFIEWDIRGTVNPWIFTNPVNSNLDLVAVWGRTFRASTNHGPSSGGTTVAITPPAGMNASSTVSFTQAGEGFGNGHYLAIGSNGKAYAWGKNTYGQLGDGSVMSKSTPVEVKTPAGVQFVKVYAGREHSLGLTQDGRLYAWGYNQFGELGMGQMSEKQLTPTLVGIPAGERVTQVSAGYNHTLAVTASGNVYAWGRNDNGQLGSGNYNNSPWPMQVASLPAGQIKQVAAGGYSSYALTTSGQLYSWGNDRWGQLGHGSSGSTLSRPTIVNSSAGGFTQVSAGDYHVLALNGAGYAYSWGYNGRGQLGTGGYGNRSTPGPIYAPAGVTFSSISAGSAHNLAIAKNGQVYGWGRNEMGQLGYSAALQPNLTAIPGFQGAKFIQAGSTSSFVVSASGKGMSMGSNTYGELGNGSFFNSSSPVSVTMPTGTAQVVVTSVTFAGNEQWPAWDNSRGAWYVTSPSYRTGTMSAKKEIMIHWTLNGQRQADCHLPWSYDGVR